MHSLCSKCTTGIGEFAGQRVVGDEVKVTFDCTACGHIWEMTL